MLQYSSNSLFQGMFVSSDVLHSQIHVALITRFLGTHAQIQQKIQLHAQTSVVVIKRAQNKKSEKKSVSKLQKLTSHAVKFDSWSKSAQIYAHPESCSASQECKSVGAPWALTAAT